MKEGNQHKRHRYIRFFISSTFADMTRERNLLQEIFSELSKFYRLNGWTIEYVDLRWGITDESGSDNRTMQICLDELKRCQQLSPKPNFIVLSGQRRGWIPLPETLTKWEARKILLLKGRRYKQLFDKWYKLDCNQLPEPVYVLQPRKGEFVAEDVWTNVYNELIDGMGNLPSATEMEIQQGALDVADSAEHVIAYIRNLTDIPASHFNTFIDEDLSKVKKFRRAIDAKLDSANIYSEDLSFDDYMSDDFSRRFKEQMSQHIKQIINHVIKEYGGEKRESYAHDTIAVEKNRLFIGRQDTLNLIDRYIRDPKASNAIWFCAKSGMGKSAIIAEVYGRYSKTHNVICRFCGETEASANGYDLLRSIWDEMLIYYTIAKNNPDKLPKTWVTEGFLSDNVSTVFKNRLRRINSDRPLLLLIDGMDRLNDEGSRLFFDMRWIDEELGQNVKVILTSTDDHRFYHSPSIKQYGLEGLSTTESMQLLSGVLAQADRQISGAQTEEIKKVIADSNRLPIYVTLLANLLCKYASYDEVKIKSNDNDDEEEIDIPSDLDGLIDYMIDNVETGGDHSYTLVRTVLNLLVCDRQGLSQDEILKALSMDKLFMDCLKKDSHHEYVGEKVPPILWSRLYHALSFIFGIRYGTSNGLVYIKDSTVKDSFYDVYLKDTHKLYRMMGIFPRYDTYSLLAKLYATIDTPHALMEAVYSNYKAAVAMYNDDHIVADEAYSVLKLLTNPHYIQEKLQLDRTDLLKDTLMLHDLAPLIKGITPTDALLLRNDIANLRASDWDKFVMQCYNLPHNSFLRGLLHYDSTLLKDELADIVPYDLTAYVSSYESPKRFVSNDGTRVLSLKSQNRSIVVEQMNKIGTQSYNINSPIKLIDVSGDLMVHALASDSEMIVYDLGKQETTECNNELPNACWLSLSEDGSTVAYGNLKNTWINKSGIQNFGGNSGKLSNSGEYLWIAIDKIVYRICLNDGETRSMDIRGYLDEVDEEFVIIAADNSNCVVNCFHKLFAFHTYLSSDGKPQFHCSRYRGNLYFDVDYAAIRDNRIIAIDSNYGKCITYNITECKIELDRETTLYGVSAVSRNGQYAFSNDNGLCYRLPKLIESFMAYEADNVGINAIATDRTGSVIVVTCGKNEFQESYRDYLLIDNGIMHKMRIDVEYTCYYSSCAVSPDGNRIWLSQSYEKGDLICVDRKGNVLAKIPNAGSKITMRLTADGKYLVALRGHHISNSNPVFDIIDDKFNIVAHFEPEGLNNLYGARSSEDMELSSNGRYAILTNFGSYFSKKTYVVDLYSQCLLSDFEAQEVVDANRKPKRFSIDDEDVITYHNPNGGHNQRAYLPDICKWVENEVGLATVTRCGKVSFFKPTR